MYASINSTYHAAVECFCDQQDSYKWPNPRGRQLNVKVCSHESAIFRSCSDHYAQQRYLANSLNIHRHFTWKLMLITAWISTTTQCLHSFKFTLVNKSHSQHSVVAVRCEGRHFLILYACAHEVSFPGQIPRSLVWERH